jgi:hypothetical protein
MPMMKCLDCPAVFPASSNGRRLRCRACVRIRIAVQKLQSQRQRLQTKRRNEMADITDSEIDARFAAALKEIRRQPSAGMEPFRSYGWQYREPRS